ncbi:MAG: MBL fold metallo-hydrolase RNA specificity domain-containing protein [Limnochordia bacterium]|jgi:metallo-beta-lactamase family protein
MRLSFHGAAGQVTGSCFLLDTDQSKILVDCGLFQGDKRIRERNYGPFPFSPGEIDAVLLTHAHIDHSGLLPKLIKHGFTGPVYATPPTVELCSVMLPDSGYIQEMEVERKNRKLSRAGKPLLEPIYTAEDALAAMAQFREVEYDRYYQILPGLQARFTDAGHILGSAAVEIVVSGPGEEFRLVFSGDLGGWDRPIVRDPVTPTSPDWLIMESTYGNRLQPDKGGQLEELGQIINDTFRRGGNVIIPAFAVERTQALLYGLHKLVQGGIISPARIYVDSPLAIAATRIFMQHPAYYDEPTTQFAERTGLSPFDIPGLVMTEKAEESMAINRVRSGAIIISASGMCEAGRIKHHLKHNLWRPECSVVFVGYQAQGSLGRQILDGNKVVRIHGEPVQVRAAIHDIEGFSAHADQRDLLRWVGTLAPKPKRVLLVHGEAEAREALSRLVTEEYGIPVELPALDAVYELERAALVVDGVVTSPAEVELQASLWKRYRSLADRLEELQRAPVGPQELAGILQALESLEEQVGRLVS